MLLNLEQRQAVLDSLCAANAKYTAYFPGEGPGRQPVHTVYGGAQLFAANTAIRLGDLGRRSFRDYAPEARILRQLFGLASDELAAKVHKRVSEKLEREPVEDLRIDFEDGFGVRPDEEEDAEAVRCGAEAARAAHAGTLPPYLGIRIKPFSEQLKARSLRTLELFIETLAIECRENGVLAREIGGDLPAEFAVTLPKITHLRQVKACVLALELIEAHAGLRPGSIALELMVEAPQTLLGYHGEVILPAMVRACKGRCRGAHFGTYDYTASMSVTADHQAMDHPSCDFARNLMKMSLAGTGVWLSDGATNVLPVALHEAPEDAAAKAENLGSVHKAWKLSFTHIQSSLRNGYYQGWDLHPAQLPVRYVALYAFFLAGLEATSRRLRIFVEHAAKATLLGNVFDDAATGQGLLNYFLRGLSCGAITEEEVFKTGLTPGELATRSFKKIIEARASSSAPS